MPRRRLIINFAPTGAVADHRRNPSVPITREQIVQSVADAAKLGATIAHLHVRGEDGSASCDPGRFGELFSAIRAHPDCRHVVLCASTSGRHGQTQEQRAAVLELPANVRPEMASLTLGSVNFPTAVSVNSPDTIRYLAQRMKEQGVKPELEVFDVGMIEFSRVLIAEGLLSPPHYFNIILGNLSSLQARPEHLALALTSLPDHSLVSIGGIGRHQRTAIAWGITAADGIRIGLEDNLWREWEPDKVPASNTDLVTGALAITHAMGRSVATHEEVRERLGLRLNHGAA